MKNNFLKKFARNIDGSNAIEFAILSPVFILLILGLIAYGIYMGAVHSVQQLAADAARASVAGLTPEERAQLTGDFIRRNAGNYLLLQPDKVNFSAQMSLDDENQFLVMIEYNATHLPIWSLYTPLPLPSDRIIRGSTIRIGGV